MERLGAGLEGSNKTMKDLKSHPFFDKIDWSTISTSQNLPFSKEETM